MKVLDKAKELAEALKESAELKDVQAKEQIVMENKEARELIEELKTKQAEFYRVQMSGKEPSEAMVTALNKFQERMEKNSLVMDYLESQENIGKILEQVNTMISAALSGEKCSEECCSGCSGCH